MALFDLISVSPASAVATDGTIEYTYPAGRAAASYAQTGEVLVAHGLQNTLAQAADTFTLAYGASSVVLTYKDATSLPAGQITTLQLPLATYKDIVALGGTITGATANDTMTAVADIALATAGGNTYTDAAVNAAVNTAIATIENNFADLQTKCNQLVALVNTLKSQLDAQNLLP